MDVVIFAVAGVVAFALMVWAASSIQRRRRNRLRDQWEEASLALGARFEHDELRLQAEGVHALLKFETASLAKPGQGDRRHLARSVLEIRVTTTVSDLEIGPEKIAASEFSEELGSRAQQLLKGLHSLGAADDLHVEAGGNVVRMDKIGWLDRCDDIVEFVSKGKRLAAELSS